MSHPLLSVQNLTVTFSSGSKPVIAVDNLSFSIDPGETVAVVGESGSGKTTAALALARLNDGRGIEILLAEIANPMGIERVEAVKSASRVRDPRVLPALRTATGDTDPEVRVVALIALGLLQDKESSALLKKIYADPTAPRPVHLAAGKAIELLTQPPAKPDRN